MNLLFAFSGGPFGIIIIILTYLTAAPLIDVEEPFDDDFIEYVNPDMTPNDPITGLSTLSSGGILNGPSDGTTSANDGSTLSDGDTGGTGSSSGFSSGSGLGFVTGSSSAGGSGSGGGSGGGSSSGGGGGSSSGGGGGSSSGGGGGSSSGGGGGSSSGGGGGSSTGSDEAIQENPKSLESTSTSSKFVGGKILQLDKAALLIAGVQTNLAWLIPVFLAAGIGLVLVKRK